MAKIVFLGIGTNLGDRKENLKNAVENISNSAGELISSSQIYETEPWGFRSEDLFLNIVIQIKTSLKPAELLKQLLKIEMVMGRVRGSEKYSSRIIDIDILLYGNEIIRKPYLKVPHPLMSERRFVLVPLCEIAPEIIHPVLGKTIATLLEECKDESVVKRTNLLLNPPLAPPRRGSLHA